MAIVRTCHKNTIPFDSENGGSIQALLELSLQTAPTVGADLNATCSYPSLNKKLEVHISASHFFTSLVVLCILSGSKMRLDLQSNLPEKQLMPMKAVAWSFSPHQGNPATFTVRLHSLTHALQLPGMLISRAIYPIGYLLSSSLSLASPLSISSRKAEGARCPPRPLPSIWLMGRRDEARVPPAPPITEGGARDPLILVRD